MEDVHGILAVIEHPGKKVLATIIRVQGSAYKKEGSAMLFFENGSHCGMLSGGCLETDLAIRVQTVFQMQEAIIHQYDLSEESDLAWGQGAGCNGTIDILLEPVTAKLQKDFVLVRELLDNYTPVTILKKFNEIWEYLFIPKVGKPFGEWSGQIPDGDEDLNNFVMEGEFIFKHTYQPKPRLLLFGAGIDAKPLASLASETGFSVAVFDWRKEYCQKENFPSAEHLYVGVPIELIKKITFSRYDFVVIMSHHFQRDQEILLSLLKEKIGYLGVLGPIERTKRLLNREYIPDWIYSPIGVQTGAKGPVEIAVSIVAEMIEVWRKTVRDKVEFLWDAAD
jgi:xanthine dehydrogenase accessory factor